MQPSGRHLEVLLVYVALTTAVISSLGMLLVPQVAEAMHVPVHTAQWMLTINLLVGTIATPIMGRLSGGPHITRLLLTALVVILAGSALAFLAPTFELFLVGRAMQGLTYGVVPVTIATARRFSPAQRTNTTIATLSVTVAAGMGLGYPLTGMLAGLFDYRAAFLFATLFAGSALIWALAAMPRPPRRRSDSVEPEAFDFLGAALMAAWLGPLLFVLSEGASLGWLSHTVLIASAVSAAAFCAWVLQEARSRSPLVDLRVFRHADVRIAHMAAIVSGGALYVTLAMMSLAVQTPGLGSAVLPVTAAGLIMVPLSVGSLIANRLVRRADNARNLLLVLISGLALLGGACFMLAFGRSNAILVILGMTLVGGGMGAAFAAMPALISRQTSATEFGSSVSINQLLRTVGGGFGSAVSAAILAESTTDGVISASGPTIALATSGALSLGLASVLLTGRLWRGLRA